MNTIESIASIFCYFAWGVFAITASWGIREIVKLERGDSDDDDDTDGPDYDEDDPQDWWKSESGREEHGKK